jgi:hypothetical protein
MVSVHARRFGSWNEHIRSRLDKRGWYFEVDWCQGPTVASRRLRRPLTPYKWLWPRNQNPTKL